MKLRLKQRLVGAVVLVALAVIFVPMLFDGPSQPPNSLRLESIPAAPGADYVPRKITLAIPGPVVPVPAPEPVAVPATEPVTVPPAAEPALDPASTPAPAPGTTWVVQVGSFSQPDNAHALRDRLRSMGFNAYVESVKDASGKSVLRVRVGPESDRPRAEALLARLKAEAALDGILRQHP